MILQEILLLISGFKRVQQKDFHIGRICTTMSSFFLCWKTKTVIWQIRKKQKNYYLLPFEKKIHKNAYFPVRLFFVMNEKLKKITILYVLTKILVKKIIVFTSIYFESCRKILLDPINQ